MIRITSKRDGFRPCGKDHPARPTEYPSCTFTEKELAQLQAEPMLVVTVIEDKPADDKKPDKKDDKKEDKAGTK